MKFVLSALACYAIGGFALAADPADDFVEWQRMAKIAPRHYVCQRCPTAPRIDGKLDDAVWRSAPFTDEFVDIEGDVRPKPRYRTRMKLLWDDRYLYVAAEMEEPHVWATITKRDAVIFHDNDFEIFLDPDGDCHEYYEFEMNALNTGWDLRLPKPYKDGGAAIDAWNIDGIRTAVHIDGTLNNPTDTDRGWSLEIALPWKALGEFAKTPAPPKVGDYWRFNSSRVEWLVDVQNGKYVKRPKTKEDNWVWSPQGVVDMHRPEMWGVVQFSDGVRNEPIPDTSMAVRKSLAAHYYWQRAQKAKHGKYTSDLPKLPDLESPPDVTGRRLVYKDGEYRCTLFRQTPAGKQESWTIDHSRMMRQDR